MVQIEVNNRAIEAKDGEMLLDALRREGIHVPTLCHMKDRFPSGACRMCVVEIEGGRGLVPSCAFPVSAGMKIQTHSPRALRARKTIVELLLADHPDDCLYCVRNGACQLQELAEEHAVRERRYQGVKSTYKMDTSSPSLIRDPAKCILCGKCVRVCEEVQKVAAIDFVGRGSTATVGTAFNQGLNTSNCVNCGQCIIACPTGALREQAYIKDVLAALNDPDKIVVVQHAPAVSVTLGEEFGLKPGSDVIGMMTAALRRMGFNYVFDTSFSADLTIMEEATELVGRVTGGGALPMFTSCSPGWIKYVEHFHPEFIPNLSTCKSPQQMLGAVIKSYFAQEVLKVPREKIYSVSIMPCTAKKFEANRPEMGHDNIPDIDAVLSTRELARMIRSAGLNLADMPSEEADLPFGERSSAGKLFGATGGVMEAAIRTAYHLITGRELEELKVQAMRGLDGIKEAHLDIDGTTVGVAVCNGLGNAADLLEQIKAGRDDLHFIEVMTCPGGCVGGGGQPFDTDEEGVRNRMRSLYTIDRDATLRTSHQNVSVKHLYDHYLGQPNGHRSHELLHTHYHARE